MNDFISLIRRFVPPYKRQVGLNILFNILSAFLNVFSFALIVPILQILFKVNDKVYEYMPMDSSSIFNFKILENNAYYYLSQTMDTHSGAAVLLILGLILVIMTILKTGTTYLSAYFITDVRTGVVRDIRKQINDKVLSLPLGFFSNERKGDIMARMTGDVGEVENSVMSSLDMISKNPIMIMIYLGTLLFISWKLSIFVFILLPISGYIMGKVGKSLKRQSVEAQNQWGGMMSQIEETLGGLRIIKAFNAEEKMIERFDKTSNVFRNMSNRIARRQQLAHPMSELLGTITIVLVLWYGGSLILEGSGYMDASRFIYYLTIFYLIINPAKDLSKSAYAIQKGMASVERIDKILKAENNIKSPANPKPIPFNREITYRNVLFRYETNWVIKDVSITIPKGKTVALVGQSGSGKSTMADLLPRFYDVNEGGIYIDDTNIKDADVHDLRALMGNVNQEAILFNDTFFNNISFGVENATMEQVIEAAKVANAHDFIMATEKGYDSSIGDRGSKLSGGQRQRVSIARAILKNPQILILDEATSALDTESERLVQDALEKLMKNRTTLVIAHRLSTIKNADEICVMSEGIVVERGHHDELYEMNGYYRKLCDMQQF
ncbi:MAG: ABC transporter ATP-binding protein [Dysgonomonas sp.]|jgi:ABC-type multidrug transport system fused ATPase/permease subunit|uniref:ABC transporter ATP-binding protein n=1 Tax=unclassified Dysgonomonas TaxID=2630389 RepID=UPI0025C00BEB|nr:MULTISPECIES: ABC transporter ATP-binding protein [unclassified Dysgonomonas]MDR1715141.1 ABC transporter ATP-binding protein/permease [Prevotella sp.]MDR2003959.1 ABC transporter ATP-binding protein/permease [Prevotella sp.]HMM03989.1 ABC transporter ATP-binding protein [Dysgonomonas sp.]